MLFHFIQSCILYNKKLNFILYKDALCTIENVYFLKKNAQLNSTFESKNNGYFEINFIGKVIIITSLYFCLSLLTGCYV